MKTKWPPPKKFLTTETIKLSGDDRRALVDIAAKAAYGVYSHRTSVDTPYERLSVEQRQAWAEVIEFLEDQIDCLIHGQPLMCLDCMSENGDLPACPECNGELVCPACKRAERKRAERAAAPKSGRAVAP